MSKASIVCSACNTDNISPSEFCINCGSKISNDVEDIKPDDKEVKKLDEYNNWKKSVPYSIAAAIFIIFIDFITGGTAWDWSYWAVIPILLFAVIAPFFSYKMSN